MLKILLALLLCSCAISRDKAEAIIAHKILFIMENGCYRVHKTIWLCDDGYYVEWYDHFKRVPEGVR